MSNSILVAALESALGDNIAPTDAATFLEQVDDLRDNSQGDSPADIIVDSIQVEHDIGTINILNGRMAQCDDQTSMESLSVALEAVVSRYGVTDLSTSLEALEGPSLKAEFMRRAASYQTSLEAVLTVSQESWAVRDLWDSVGAVERMSYELDESVKILNSRKTWFSDNGILINGIGQLTYMTLNNQLSKNLAGDTAATLGQVEHMMEVAEDATVATTKIREMVKAANIQNDHDALTLLSKVAALKNPSVQGRQKLDGNNLLGNRRSMFKVADVTNKHGLKIGDWEKVGMYEEENLGRLNHGVKSSKLLRIPAWFLTFGIVSNITAAVVGASLAGIIVGAAAAFTVTHKLNDHKAGAKAKEMIKFDQVQGSFEKIVALTRTQASKRRALPSVYERMFTFRDEVKSLLGEHENGLGDEGKAALKAVKAIYSNAEKLSWTMNTYAYLLLKDMVYNSTLIANKMIKGSSK